MDLEIKGYGPATLPDFFILGAAKGGTSSLFRYFGEHPDIHIPPVKEPWFFSFPLHPGPEDRMPNLGDPVTDLDSYVRLFAACSPGQITGEASPSYLFTYRTAIAGIRSIYPEEAARNLKFFITLRNPVDRAWSMYWTFARVLKEDLEFEEAIAPETIARRRAEGAKLFKDYIGVGRYTEQIKAWQDAFGAERIQIILFDDLKRDATGVCREAFTFLGVDPDFQPDTSRIYNVSGKPRSKGFIRMLLSDNPVKSAFKAVVSRDNRRKLKNLIGRRALAKVEMAPETRRRLQDIYRDEILQLQDVLQRDLSSWLD